MAKNAKTYSIKVPFQNFLKFFRKNTFLKKKKLSLSRKKAVYFTVKPWTKYSLLCVKNIQKSRWNAIDRKSWKPFKRNLTSKMRT